jgi:hypothetical protein
VERRILGAIDFELGGHLRHLLLHGPHAGLEHVLLALQLLHLLALALAGVVCGEAVSLDALDAALLLFVLGLGPLAGWQVGLGLGQDLAPRLALLGGFGGTVWHWGRRLGGGRGVVLGLEVLHLDSSGVVGLRGGGCR